MRCGASRREPERTATTSRSFLQKSRTTCACVFPPVILPEAANTCESNDPYERGCSLQHVSVVKLDHVPSHQGRHFHPSASQHFTNLAPAYFTYLSSKNLCSFTFGNILATLLSRLYSRYLTTPEVWDTILRTSDSLVTFQPGHSTCSNLIEATRLSVISHRRHRTDRPSETMDPSYSSFSSPRDLQRPRLHPLQNQQGSFTQDHHSAFDEVLSGSEGTDVEFPGAETPHTVAQASYDTAPVVEDLPIRQRQPLRYSRSAFEKEPFDFSALPPELRDYVYEFYFPGNVYAKQRRGDRNVDGHGRHLMALNSDCLALLQVNRLIYREAASWLGTKRTHYIGLSHEGSALITIKEEKTESPSIDERLQPRFLPLFQSTPQHSAVAKLLAGKIEGKDDLSWYEAQEIWDTATATAKIQQELSVHQPRLITIVKPFTCKRKPRYLFEFVKRWQIDICLADQSSREYATILKHVQSLMERVEEPHYLSLNFRGPNGAHYHFVDITSGITSAYLPDAFVLGRQILSSFTATFGTSVANLPGLEPRLKAAWAKYQRDGWDLEPYNLQWIDWSAGGSTRKTLKGLGEDTGQARKQARRENGVEKQQERRRTMRRMVRTVVMNNIDAVQSGC